MRIYSDKWENVVLWDGDLPGGAVALDAAATEANLEERYEQLIDDYCKKYGVNEDAEKWTDYDATMADHAQQDAWEALWTPGNADDCYVWIKNTPSTMGRKGGKSKSDAKTAAARENGKRGGRPRFIRTLRELIDEHDANGVVMIDAGNGSAGPRWVPLEGIDEDMLSVSMGRHMSAPANRDARSATGDDKYIVRWASDWIEDDDRGGDFEVQNPWRYRLLF